MKKIKVLSIIGTRPEVVKMAPVIKELEKYPDQCESMIISTAQHREMLDQTLQVFGIKPDIDLNIMRPDQSLTQITAATLGEMEQVLKKGRPDVVLVQGDTTTAFATSLAAFYQKIRIGHVEAGLRSHDQLNPYPEEVNRQLADVLTDYYFSPTDLARNNLLREGVREEKIFVTGNTVIDALKYALTIPYASEIPILKGVDIEKERLVLVTAHRRENWDGPLAEMCEAFKDLARRFSDLRIVYPVHLNPNVRRTVLRSLAGIHNVHLIDPVDYLSMVNLMKMSYLILTDSGGIQEEAPYLGKPVLVMRDVTERPEACEAGLSKIVGTSHRRIVEEVERLFMDRAAYQQMSKKNSVYGDGKSAQRIVQVLLGQKDILSNKGRE